MWFLSLSRRFIIQLSSKTHVKLEMNRAEDPPSRDVSGKDQPRFSGVTLHQQRRPAVDVGDGAPRVHLVNTFWFGRRDCKGPVLQECREEET